MCRVREGIPPFGILYVALPCFLRKWLLPGLEPVIFQSRDTNFTVAPRLPLLVCIYGIKYLMNNLKE